MEAFQLTENVLGYVVMYSLELLGIALVVLGIRLVILAIVGRFDD